MISQSEVRTKYLKRIERERQDWIAKQTGIPAPVLSRFKSGTKDLYPGSLELLNDYLDGKLEEIK